MNNRYDFIFGFGVCGILVFIVMLFSSKTTHFGESEEKFPFRSRSQEWLIREEKQCDKMKDHSYFCEEVRKESERAF